ncbi:hypothetical protein OKW34_008777 [Paraburkholderia youngii]
MIGRTLVRTYTMRWLMLTPPRTAGENSRDLRKLWQPRETIGEAIFNMFIVMNEYRTYWRPSFAG